MTPLATLLEEGVYEGYAYAYPHKTAYRPLLPRMLDEVWEREPKNALYLYSGSSGRFITKAGSSRVPNGRASLPAGSPQRALYGCTNVTRTAGQARFRYRDGCVMAVTMPKSLAVFPG